MPLIELKCKQCGYTAEELVKSGEYPRCPKCGGEREQKYSGSKTPSYKKNGCGGNCSQCGGCH